MSAKIFLKIELETGDIDIDSNDIKRKYLLCEIIWLTSQTTFPQKKEWKCQCVDIENNS